MCAFWFDFWVKGVRLSDRYPRIVAAAQSLDTSLSNVHVLSDRWHWRIPLRYDLRGGASEEWNHLIRYLDSIPLDTFTSGPTSVIWPLDASGLFSVTSLRMALIKERYIGVPQFPTHTIWCSTVPSKIICFCWRVYFKKIATIDNLQRKGLQLVNRCALCLSHLESVDHIFLHCDYSIRIWNQLSSTLSIYGPKPVSTTDLITAWKGMNCAVTFAPAIKVMLHAFFWLIWKERNDRIFNDISHNHRYLANRILLTLMDWLLAAGRLSASSANLWRRLLFDNG
ncbi:hypothetical protein LINPERHAP1_LOCUS27662 [Linum perenne]